MHETNLLRFDLNLLVVFDAIMRERHIGRAGEKLGLTQPAVSHALARLRHLLDDPLFVRHARGVKPTPRAEELAVPFASALQAIQATLAARTTFDPRQARRTFTIGGTDYTDLTLMPTLLAALRKEAPGFDIRLCATSRKTVHQDLQRRKIDFAIGPLFAAPETIEVTPLFSERLVLVARRGHPALAKRLTLREFANLSHLLVSPSGDAIGMVDNALREAGLSRRIVLTVPHFLVAPFIVGSTDLIALLAEHVANRLADAAGISIDHIPLPVEPWTVGFARLKESPSDPAFDWLSRLVARVANEL